MEKNFWDALLLSYIYIFLRIGIYPQAKNMIDNQLYHEYV